MADRPQPGRKRLRLNHSLFAFGMGQICANVPHECVRPVIENNEDLSVLTRDRQGLAKPARVTGKGLPGSQGSHLATRALLSGGTVC